MSQSPRPTTPGHDFLRIKGLRQIELVELDLSKRVTILAGANGSGKTTILKILSLFIGWGNNSHPDFEHSVNGKLNGSKFDSNLKFTEATRGIFVPAHRRGYEAQAVKAIPTSWTNPTELLMTFQTEEGKRGPSHGLPNLRLKEGLVSSALFGYSEGAGILPSKPARQLFENFQEVLRNLLPESLGFKSLEVQSPEVFLVTNDGRIPLDTVSGGTASLLDLAWQLCLAQMDESSSDLLVLIDEIENHLHPAAQRVALPTLVKAFPKAKWVVATHSPHVFASIEDAEHVVLQRSGNDETGGFMSRTVPMPASLLTPDDVLRDALGLDVTMPLWVEERIDAIVKKHSNVVWADENYVNIREELSSIGLSAIVPQVIAKVLDSQP